MYMQPETARLFSAQRIHEMQARAEAGRHAVEIRKARRSTRTGVARWPWLARRRTVGRPVIAAPVPQNT